MRAAVEARPCKRNGCRNNVPAHAAPQARYCGTEDCNRERGAERKALQHAREQFAYTRVVLELEEPPKRRTSEDEGERGASDRRTPPLPHGDWSQFEDRESPGALWLRGEHEAAVAQAEREQTRKLRECEALPNGYLQGGQLWDGMHLAPRRRDEEPAPRTRLSDEQRDQLRTYVRRARERMAAKDPSPDVCDALMRANRGLG